MRELFGLQKDEFFIGMIFGFPDDEEQDIVDNYTFLTRAARWYRSPVFASSGL